MQGGPTSQYVAEITYMGIIAIQGPYDSAAEAASEFVLWRLLFVLRGKSPLLVFLGLMPWTVHQLQSLAVLALFFLPDSPPFVCVQAPTTSLRCGCAAWCARPSPTTRVRW